MYCQLVYICGLIPARIRHALANLPETLDKTYERTLREISEAEWEFANRLFQFVAVAVRPLYVEELAELLAFDFEAMPVPKFYEGWRLDDPIHAVQSTCPSFFSIVDEKDVEGKDVEERDVDEEYSHTPRKIIQFSHFSIKEFLTSARLKSKHINLCRYHVSDSSAHTIAAQACLGILLHLDKDVVTSSLENYPLLNMLRSIGLTILGWRMCREKWRTGRNAYSTQASHTLRSVSGYMSHTFFGGIES